MERVHSDGRHNREQIGRNSRSFPNGNVEMNLMMLGEIAEKIIGAVFTPAVGRVRDRPS